MAVLELSEKSKSVQLMFDKIAPRYDFLNRLLSGRQDVRWRRHMIKKIPVVMDSKGLHLDVACGTGDVMIELLKSRPDFIRTVGVDISEGMMNAGQVRAEFLALAQKRPETRVEFLLGSAEDVPFSTAMANAVTISFGLRNVDNRSRALNEFFRVLKPKGRLYVLEFFKSDKSWMASAFDFYFKNVLPRIGGLVSDRSAYDYLPRSVSSMPSSSEFKSVLESSGFRVVEEVKWLFGATRLFVAEKP